MKKETWFITAATDAGVTRMIAEAVEGYKHQDTSVIGITSWGVVNMKEVLIQEDTKVKIPKYPICKERHRLTIERKGKRYYYLNKDHTHFFLVDTGLDGIFTSREIQFRHKFEKYIVDKQTSELKSKQISFPIFMYSIQILLTLCYANFSKFCN